MNYNKINNKNEKMKDVEKEIKVYLMKTCIQYIDSTHLLKNNPTEYNKFLICLKILRKITNKRLNYGERLLNKINNDVTKDDGDNNNVTKDR